VDLVIRADASDAIGGGHVMRCATLAKEWINSGYGKATLHGAVSLPLIARRLAQIGVGIAAVGQEASSAAILVVDTYDRAERDRCARLPEYSDRVLIDDLGEPVPVGYSCVWNPNPLANRSLYPDFNGVFIGGPHTIPIRDGLPIWTGSGSRLVGVFVGAGTQPSDILQALDGASRLMPGWRFAGAGDWVPDGWEKLDADDPWRGLASCAVAITTSGTSLWECAAVGIPVVALCVATNQFANSEWARAQGVPVVSFLEIRDSAAMVSALARAVTVAIPLPRLQAGTKKVAAVLWGLRRMGEAESENRRGITSK
jgi:hypothetical protein